MVYEKNRQEANVLFMKNLLEVELDLSGDDDPLQPLPLGMASKDWASKDSFYSVCKMLLDSEEMRMPPLKSVDSTFLLPSSQGGFNDNDEKSNDGLPCDGMPVALLPSSSRKPAAKEDIDMMCRFQSAESIDFDVDLFEQDLKGMELVVPSNRPVPTRKVNKRKRDTEKHYITDAINPHDVLFGQGGQSNNNEGNARYRTIVERIRPIYGTASMAEKTTIAQDVVKEVASNGGRFLTKDKKSQQWYLADDRAARKKVSQALREKYFTAEDRAIKRKRYPKDKQ